MVTLTTLILDYIPQEPTLIFRIFRDFSSDRSIPPTPLSIHHGEYQFPLRIRLPPTIQPYILLFHSLNTSHPIQSPLFPLPHDFIQQILSDPRD